jgi:hypothetical protein
MSVVAEKVGLPQVTRGLLAIISVGEFGATVWDL